jgi:hypothetical protein
MITRLRQLTHQAGPGLRRLWLGAALAVLALTIGGVAVVRAQQPICRDFDNLTVCADEISEQNGTTLLFSRVGRPGVTIAPKGGAPVLIVDGITDPTTQLPLGGQFASLPAGSPRATLLGGRHIVAGGIRFAEDSAATAHLLTSRQLNDFGGPAESGYMLVDTVQRRLTLPPPNTPLYQGTNLLPVVNFRFKFLERPDLIGLSNGSTDGSFRLNQMSYEFDLNSKKFSALVPIEPKSDDSERPFTAAVTMRINIDHKGLVSGTVDAFKVKLAGLVGSAEQIKLVNGGMEAAFVNFSKVDNPDLPNFDPTNQNLIFQLQKLQYKNKRFAIGGGAVGIKDWEFGESFKMVNQTIGLSFDDATKSTFFTVNSTLQTKRLLENGNPLAVTMRITRRVVGGVGKPVVEAGIANFTPTLGGVMKANLKNVKLIFDSVRNFYGITAETAELQYPAHLGGRVAAGVGNFKIGINKDKQPIFSLGNGTVGLPEFESKVLKGSLAGTVGMVGATLQFTLTGNLTVLLPKNSGVGTTANMIFRSGANVCEPGQSTPASVLVGAGKGGTTGGAANCLKRYEQTLSGFNVKLAGFEFNLVNPRGLEDGGFAVDEAGFKMPTIFNRADNASTGLSVKGLRVAGDGKVSVTGGSFELAPFKIGDKQLVGVKGAFESLPDGGYKFVGGGTFPIGGLEATSAGTAIGATVTVLVKPDDSFGGGVEIFFQATPGKGMKIGSTGAEITRIGGGFSFNDGSALALNFGIRASTLARLPDPINLPILTADGNVTLQFAPTKLTANAKLSLLIFQIAQANIGIGQGVAFNNTAPGFHADLSINVFIINGGVKVDVGRTTVNGVAKTRVQASAFAAIGIKEDTFGFIPRNDLTLASVSLSGGHFVDNRSGILGGGVERFGLKGTVEVAGFDKSIFIDIGSQNGVDLIVLGVNNIDPVTAQALRANAAQGVTGYRSLTFTPAEARAMGMALPDNVLNAADGADFSKPIRIQQDAMPIVLTQTTQLQAGLFYDVGAPVLRLRLPDGTVLTRESVASPATRYGKDTGDGKTFEGFQVSEAAPGVYELIIDNAPVSYTAQIEQHNIAPKLSAPSVTCGGEPIPGVSVACGGPTNVPPGAATITWDAGDADSPDAEVRVGYVTVNEAASTGPIDYSQIHVLTDSLPLGTGSYTWELGETPTGKYKLVVIAEDNGSPAVWKAADAIIEIVDQRAPSVPTGLSSAPGAGELLVNWSQNPEADLAGYEIGFGIVNDGQPDDAAHFVYSRDMGPKEIVTGTSNIVDGKLWGLTDNEDLYYSVRAYDLNGNRSEWAPIQMGKPWPLAPEGISPLPRSISNTTLSRIEIGFATPVLSATIVNALSVVDEAGAIVEGVLEYLVDETGEKVLGLSFIPANGLKAETSYTATLAAGTQAEDGRSMPSDYMWRFTTGQATLRMFLPLIGHE